MREKWPVCFATFRILQAFRVCYFCSWLVVTVPNRQARWLPAFHHSIQTAQIRASDAWYLELHPGWRMVEPGGEYENRTQEISRQP